jgi:hypothetical protein
MDVKRISIGQRPTRNRPEALAMQIKGKCPKLLADQIAGSISRLGYGGVKAKVLGRLAIVRSNSWFGTSVDPSDQYYLTADLIQDTGGKNFAEEGLPDADEELQALLEQVSWEK